MIVCIGNLLGLFIIFIGEFGYCGCWGVVGCREFFITLGCSSLWFVINCVLSVLVCIWIGHGVGQF